MISTPEPPLATELVLEPLLPTQTSMPNSGGDQEDRIQENPASNKPTLVYSRRPRDPQQSST